jgi:hypothetical protein
MRVEVDFAQANVPPCRWKQFIAGGKAENHPPNSQKTPGSQELQTARSRNDYKVIMFF